MILITGGCGFCGGHLARTLADRGREVRVLDVQRPEYDASNVDVVLGDVRDVEAVEAAMDDVDTVFHAAALVPVTRAGREFRSVNVEGTRVVLEAAQRADVERFVHVGSSSVYALDEMPVTEETPLRPKGPYSASKIQADRLVLDQDEVPASVVRPRTVVGPRRAGIFQILFDWVQEGRRVYTIGDGDSRFQMISPGDLTRALLAVAEATTGGTRVYNVGTDTFGTMRDVLQQLVDHAATGSRVASLPRLPSKAALWSLDKLRLSPLTAFHYKTIDKDFHFDVSRALDELDWRPRHGNEDCITRAYDWYVEEGGRQAPDDGAGHRHSPPERVLGLLRRLS